jgi:hypothetical protein
MSDRALAAAARPKSLGSSTMGGKKSAVETTAIFDEFNLWDSLSGVNILGESEGAEDIKCSTT